FSTLLALRMLVRMYPQGYGVFYDGPVILCYLILASVVLRTMRNAPSTPCRAERFFCLACVGFVLLAAVYVEKYLTPDRVPLSTQYGTIRTTRDMADGYTAAIAFMKQKAAQHQVVLSIPEDTSLYFLSGTECPIRVFEFTPGVVAPGHMTEEL